MASPALWRVLRPSQLDLRDFSGGWNLRDSPSEVAKNESPDCLNVSVDERGGVVKRLGMSRLGSSSLAGVGQMVYYSQTLQVTLVQVGAALYKTTDFTTLTLVGTFSTSARLACVDFNGSVVLLHKADGVYTYDGTTLTSRNTTVKGTCLAVWQNKVWAGGDPVNQSRVWWSNLGDATAWTTASAFVDIRDKDSAAITALGVGQGMDVAGRPGLLVFKEESTYRINSSSTGSYTTLHAHAGAAGPACVTDLNGLTVALCKIGLYMTDGVNPPKEMSRKVSPLFRDDQLDFSNLAIACAGVKGDRMLFSMPRRIGGSAQASNNFTLEFSPTEGWIVPHSFGLADMTSYAKQAAKLYGLSPTTAFAWEVFKTGADDGAAIACHYQTPWFEPTAGGKCSYNRLRVAGRGTFSMYVRGDYSLGQGSLRGISIVGSGFVWNDAAAIWNAPGVLWGPSAYEGYQHAWGLGIYRSVSLYLSESSTLSALGPKLQGDGSAPEVGAFALYELNLQFVPLGGA